ncbi:uncharacterized protein RCC_03898 [Ramularia collo-cygni]|uniref:Uncharacterized protein n=1 Tax=Ramularia collo-cygni TaxID=112498 RepID=A0A2D3UY00_9PEZI|nr:uncharacterized protein RCC_03898 [Ramularia collo-cygni]CZT18060.1 uncharacterized protein RCC_03898 [Ramularia collo-cygni]
MVPWRREILEFQSSLSAERSSRSSILWRKASRARLDTCQPLSVVQGSSVVCLLPVLRCRRFDIMARRRLSARFDFFRGINGFSDLLLGSAVEGSNSASRMDSGISFGGFRHLQGWEVLQIIMQTR